MKSKSKELQHVNLERSVDDLKKMLSNQSSDID